MNSIAKYTHVPEHTQTNVEKNDEKIARMTRTERREMLKKFQLYRLILNCGLSFFVITMFLAMPFMQNVLTALYPDTYAGLHDAAELIYEDRNATLPDGYWIDDEKSTERILCIRAWDGSWMTWSWGSFRPWFELNHHSGWFFPVLLFAITAVSGSILGTIVTKVVPLKHSLLWKNSEIV